MRVVYAVYGDDRAFLEMRRSANSLREIHPNATIDCFTNAEGMERVRGAVDRAHLHETPTRETDWHDPNFKVSAIHAAAVSPFIFLDNDTLVAGDLSEAWRLLEDYDIMAVSAPIENQRRAKGMKPLDRYDKIPEAFAEVNSGVLFVRPTEKSLKCLQAWRDLLSVNPDELGDQWRLRIALYEKSPRLMRLSANYNFRLSSPQSVYGPVRILHGHHPNIHKVATEINKGSSFRSFFFGRSGNK